MPTARLPEASTRRRTAKGRGREELFRDQVPELLRSLAERTRVASIQASNAIEGVEVGPERAERLAEGARFRNRSEREFAGYRDAIDEIMRTQPRAVSVPLILHLHRQIFRHADGRGGAFKQTDDLIVSYETGRRTVLFEPPPHGDTPFLVSELVDRYLAAQLDGVAHPLVVMAAFVLDLLAIHPVADGNGRVARLVTTHELLGLGYGVARYVSVEQEVFESKHAYYAALASSQRGWHEGAHSIWLWTEYLQGVLADTYERFEQRVAAARAGHGRTKQDRVRGWIVEHAPPSFRLADVRRAVPGVSDQTIRLVLGELRDAGALRCEGSGRAASWLRR